MRAVNKWDVARQARYAPKVPPVVGLGALAVGLTTHVWGMDGLTAIWVLLALAACLCLASRYGFDGPLGMFALVCSAIVTVVGLLGVRWLGKQYGAGVISAWLILLGLALILGALGWWAWDRLLREESTAQQVTRAKDQNNIHEGSASIWDLAQYASAATFRAKAGVVRPSLRTWSKWQLRRLPASAYCVLLLTTGASLGPTSKRMRVHCSTAQVTMRTGGPQMGKSVSLACHILDAPGAALVTSTRYDLLVATGAQRSTRGRVSIFNPTGLGGIVSSARWSPLSGCEDYSTAQRRAQDMIPDRPGDGQIWSDHGRRVLAVMLHAAALLPTGSMRTIQGWVANPGDSMRDAVIRALAGASSPDSLVHEIRQFAGLNDRTKTSVTATLALALNWLTSARCAAIGDAPRAEWFDIRQLVASGRDTLYLIGSPDLAAVGPLISALTGEVAYQLRQVAGMAPAGRLDPPFNMILDELALACKELPVEQYTADMGGRGVQIHLSAQSLAQLRQNLGETRADALLNNVGALLIFGGTKASEDLETLAKLTGERLEQLDEDDKRYVGVLSPAAISRLPEGQAMAFLPGLRPVLGRAPQVWRRRDYREWTPPREPAALDDLQAGWQSPAALVPPQRTLPLAGIFARLRTLGRLDEETAA